MKSLLNIDRATGRVVDSNGTVVFDPDAGPRFGLQRPNSVRGLFEGTAEDGVVVSVSFVEANGGYLHFFADHPKFGTSWNDWTEAQERARISWLVDFLEKCGASAGLYSWGKIEAVYDSKGAQGLVTISYEAQQIAARDAGNPRA